MRAIYEATQQSANIVALLDRINKIPDAAERDFELNRLINYALGEAKRLPAAHESARPPEWPRTANE